MSTFQLDPQLDADTHLVGEFELSLVLLLDDRRYPWIILVPRRAGMREIHALAAADRALLMDESCRVGEWLLDNFDGDSLNVGALGNRVRQLHLHHVVRRTDDPAWPGPVWGHSPLLRYDMATLAERLAAMRAGLGITAVRGRSRG